MATETFTLTLDDHPTVDVDVTINDTSVEPFDPTHTITVSNSGNNYIFTGSDRSTTFTNLSQPSLTFLSGDKVRFNVNSSTASGHPFYIKTQQGTGSSNQAAGVVGGGSTQVDWTTATAGVGSYGYQCSAHFNMWNTISLTEFAKGQVASPHSSGANTSQDQFNSDGTKWSYATVSNGPNLTFYDFSLSTAYDLTTISAPSLRNLSFPNLADVEGMTWNDDGTELLVYVFMQSGTNNRSRAYTFTTSTPYAATGITSIPNSYVDTARSGGYGTSNGIGFKWSGDGTKLFVAAHTAHLKQCEVSTAYDVSTITSYQTISPLDLGVTATAFWGVEFNNDGTKGYLLESQGSTQELFSFDLSTAYDFTTASLDQELDIDDTGDYDINYPFNLSRTDKELIVYGLVTNVGYRYTYIAVAGGF